VVNVVAPHLHHRHGREAQLVPGVCGVVPGSVHPGYTGIEAGLSATVTSSTPWLAALKPPWPRCRKAWTPTRLADRLLRLSWTTATAQCW